MINLIAGRQVVPELIQSDMNGRRIAEEAGRLLKDESRRLQMKRDLAEVAAKLSSTGNAIARAADEIVNLMEVEVVRNA
jgi:lipid-A-disaccharide synthase